MSKKKPCEPNSICAQLQAWAEVADVSSPRCGEKQMAIYKSDLLNRMIYGGEMPSRTPCPVHKGVWSGIQWGWPGSFWVDGQGEKTPSEVQSHLQIFWDMGCRCAYHKGSTATTGWNPDEHCGCGEITKVPSY